MLNLPESFLYYDKDGALTGGGGVIEVIHARPSLRSDLSGVFRWGRGGRAPYPRAKKKRGGGERRRPTPAHVRTHTWCKYRS